MRNIFNNLWDQIECEFQAKIEFNNDQVLSKQEYYQQLCNNHLNDLKTGYTTNGPHKDNINLFFNDMPIKMVIHTQSQSLIKKVEKLFKMLLLKEP